MSSFQAQQRYGCYIGNIDRSVTLEMLKQVFRQCGTIIDCSLNGRNEDPYRYGFIDFANEDDRQRAMKYNGFTLVGRKLKVGVSKGNVSKSDAAGNTNNNMNNNNNNRMGRNNMNNNISHGMGKGNDGSNAASNGLTPQQQVEAQLLLQFINQGSMDPRSLTPAQQQLLLTCLSQGGAGGSAAGAVPASTSLLPPQQQQQQQVTSQQQPHAQVMMQPMNPQVMGNVPVMNSYMTNPMMGTPMWGGAMGAAGMTPHTMRGMYPGMMTPSAAGGNMNMNQQAHNNNNNSNNMNGNTNSNGNMMNSNMQGMGYPGGSANGGHMRMNNNVYHRGPANALPSEETVKLREVQRKQFLDVVRKEAERYEKKIMLKEGKDEAALGKDEQPISNSDDSDGSDEEDEVRQSMSQKKKRTEPAEVTLESTSNTKPAGESTKEQMDQCAEQGSSSGSHDGGDAVVQA